MGKIRLTHATSFQDFEPFLGGLLLRLVLDQIFQSISVRHPHSIRFESLVHYPLWLLEAVAKHTIQTIVPTPEQNVAVRRLERLVRDNRGYIGLVLI
jgi:hypothetical protein